MRRQPPGSETTCHPNTPQTPDRHTGKAYARDHLALYLAGNENRPGDIDKLQRLLTLRHILLEIGCGDCEVARKIALENPDWGVIATDKYDCDISSVECSYYQKQALDWKAERLAVQRTVPDNMIILRAEAELLRFLPDHSVDSLLMVNPEPSVGKACLTLLAIPSVYAKLKPGGRQIVVVPFSRELGVSTCGGYEFDHSEDWSMGLGFIMSSAFKFRKSDHTHWGIDLRRSSSYSQNSTQTNVYVFGTPG
jgi:hypothetical protein